MLSLARAGGEVRSAGVPILEPHSSCHSVLTVSAKKKYYKAEQSRQDAVPGLLLIAVLKEG